ncbi:MAG: type II secretion system protein [Alphaproteobacteria bacterium]|nr:type II secretion system protein [Alphaproteobacteria bacterium]
MRGKKNHKSGFSLIELSIVMVIAGILLSAFLQFYSVSQKAAKYETTKQRLRDIKTALTHYVILNGHLPCPASPAGEYSAEQCAKRPDPMPGVERYKINPAHPANDGLDEVWIGIFPVKELRFTYFIFTHVSTLDFIPSPVVKSTLRAAQPA